jgi:hypothetical protein
MNEFFLSIWKKRDHKSEISGKKIYGEPLSTYFHHLLSKKKYPEAAYDEENIIILTFEEHDKVEMDMYFYEEINKRREKLKIKYGLI